MLYVSKRCRTSAYDVAYYMQHVGDNMSAAWGAQAFLARLLEVSKARSFAILYVFRGFEENVLA